MMHKSCQGHYIQFCNAVEMSMLSITEANLLLSTGNPIRIIRSSNISGLVYDLTAYAECGHQGTFIEMLCTSNMMTALLLEAASCEASQQSIASGCWKAVCIDQMAICQSSY